MTNCLLIPAALIGGVMLLGYKADNSTVSNGQYDMSMSLASGEANADAYCRLNGGEVCKGQALAGLTAFRDKSAGIAQDDTAGRATLVRCYEVGKAVEGHNWSASGQCAIQID